MSVAYADAFVVGLHDGVSVTASFSPDLSHFILCLSQVTLQAGIMGTVPFACSIAADVISCFLVLYPDAGTCQRLVTVLCSRFPPSVKINILF